MLFKNGDRLTHTESGKLCTFKEYEMPEWTEPHDCAWVIFDRIWFKKNVEKLVYIKNIKSCPCSQKRHGCKMFGHQF